jgi:hypothetical protein
MRTRSRIAISVLTVTALLAGTQHSSMAGEGRAQRTATQVTPVTPAPGPADSQALLKRIADLEKRVKDLEKERELDFKSEQEDDAKAARLEERLAALERAPRLEGGSGRGSGTATTTGVATRVQAPFEVVSRDGRPIARIVEWGELAGGVYVFGKGGGSPIAILGPIKDEPGGRVAVFQADGTGSSLTAASQGATLTLRTPGSKASVFLQAAGQMDLFNAGGTAAFSVTARTAGNGRLTLGDADGNTMVEAGSSRDGVGIVRAGPRLGGTTGTLVPPTALVGQK